MLVRFGSKPEPEMVMFCPSWSAVSWLTDIDEYFDRPVGTYSAGMRSRFTFSLMLALEFDLYLIDEGMPTTTDVEFNRKAGAVLYDRLKSATVVVVSHQAHTIEELSDQLAEQWRVVEQVRTKLDRLTERFLLLEEGAGEAPAITRPPHY